MHVLLSSYGSRGDFGPMADLPRRPAEWVAAQFGTVAAAAEACDALVATGLLPAGVWL
jgi:vancomycin aglycone glucosyltransferase